MQITISAMLSLLILFVCVAFLITIRRRLHAAVGRQFSYLLLVLIIWSLASMVVFSFGDSQANMLWDRERGLLLTSFTLLFYALVRAYRRRPRQTWFWTALVIYLGLQAASFLIDPKAVRHLLVDLPSSILNAGVWADPLARMLLLGLSGWELWRGFQSARQTQHRRRLLTLLAAAGLLFFSTPLSLVLRQAYAVDLAANLLAVLLIGFALQDRRVLTLADAWRWALVASVPTLLIAVVYFLGINMALQTLRFAANETRLILSTLLALLTALITLPLHDRAKAWINRRFFAERWALEAILRRLDEQTLKLADLEKLPDLILAELAAVYHLERAAIFSSVDDGLFLTAAEIDTPSEDLSFSPRLPLVVSLAAQGRPLTVEEIWDLPGIQLQEGLELQASQLAIFAPLSGAEGLYGFMALGAKGSGESYSEADIQFLITLTTRMAAALEQAMRLRGERLRCHQADNLRQAVVELTSMLDSEMVVDGILTHLEKVVPFDSASVQMRQGDQIRIVAGRGYVAHQQLIGRSFPAAQDRLYKKIESSAQTLIIPDASQNSIFLGYGDITNVHSWMGVPLILQGKVIGCLTLDSQERSAYGSTQALAAQAFANHAALVIENARLFGEVQRLAITDELTGIHNRRRLFELGEGEIQRFRRSQRPLCAMMIDIDDFKSINDTYGHRVGDEVLVALAQRGLASIRQIDIFGRYGGDEFIIILPETGLALAEQIGARLHYNIGSIPVDTSAGKLPISISIGIAAYQEEMGSLEAFFDAFDRKLYAAKRDPQDQEKNASSVFAERGLKRGSDRGE